MSLILSKALDLNTVEFTEEEIEVGADVLYGKRMPLEEAESFLNDVINDSFVRSAISNCPICSGIAKDLNIEVENNAGGK